MGILIIKGSQFLVGQRHGAHGEGTWAPPGGHVEWLESVEEAAIREAKEETGLTVVNPRIVGVTNAYFDKEDKHYITVYLAVDHVSGEPTILEPDKFISLKWVDMDSIPEPMFLTWEKLVNSPARQRLVEELT